jgi:hypothetical protein
LEVILEVTLEFIKAITATLLLLLLGDFFSTFLYHVPEHVFGKFHSIVHHGKNRSFLHYAVLTKNPLVLLDGMLGAVPYFIFTPWLWHLSAVGTIIGLLLGEFHVVWRHGKLQNLGNLGVIYFLSLRPKGIGCIIKTPLLLLEIFFLSMIILLKNG